MPSKQTTSYAADIKYAFASIEQAKKPVNKSAVLATILRCPVNTTPVRAVVPF